MSPFSWLEIHLGTRILILQSVRLTDVLQSNNSHRSRPTRARAFHLGPNYSQCFNSQCYREYWASALQFRTDSFNGILYRNVEAVIVL